MKFKTFAYVTLCLSIFTVDAQKIKYKDLQPVLASKNYSEGIPKLFQFLSDPKNVDEPNANLQLGLWLEDRFKKYDVVNDSSKIYEVGDSAVFYLERSKTLITEKELKKRDKYYQAFFRRDLRTGEFGIKISDVHLDIEKKVESVEQRISEIKAMHKKVLKVEKHLQDALADYKEISSQFSKYNAMLIGADDAMQTKLAAIEENGRKSEEEAEAVQELAETLGADKYRDDAQLMEIAQFGVDGLDQQEIRSGSITMWNYQEWARAAKSEIMGGIGLFKTMIKNFSNESRDKKEKAKKGQNVEIGEFPSDLKSQFDKYDPGSTVESLLNVELLEAKVIKQVDLQINPALMDSSLIGHQLVIYESALVLAKDMNTIVEGISAEDLAVSKTKYKSYIESFFQDYVTASKYVTDMQVWSRRQIDWLTNSIEYWTEQNRWGIYTPEEIEEGEDPEIMYPLFVTDIPENGKMTLDVPVKNPDEVVIYGLESEENKGFIFSFGPDRRAQWKLDFDLIEAEAPQYESDSIPTAEGSSSFYLFDRAAQEENFTVVSYTEGGQLNWATTVTLSKAPVDFKFDDLTQDLTILLYPEEDLPLDSDDLGYIVIDRSGNAR